MPSCVVVFYRDDDGGAPALDWIRAVGRRDQRIVQKLQARIERLEELGHELRRPEADLLRDGIHELRARLGTTNYRLLYFFDGRNFAVIVHGLTKEADVPATEIERALDRRRRYERDPKAHRFEPEEPDEQESS